VLQYLSAEGFESMTVAARGRRLVEVVLVSDAGKICRNAGAAAVFRDLGEDAERPGHLDRGQRTEYRSSDNPIGGDQQARRDREAKRIGCLVVDNKIDLCR
jgi:hypothetical protein